MSVEDFLKSNSDAVSHICHLGNGVKSKQLTARQGLKEIDAYISALDLKMLEIAGGVVFLAPLRSFAVEARAAMCEPN